MHVKRQTIICPAFFIFPDRFYHILGVGFGRMCLRDVVSFTCNRICMKVFHVSRHSLLEHLSFKRLVQKFSIHEWKYFYFINKNLKMSPLLSCNEIMVSLYPIKIRRRNAIVFSNYFHLHLQFA